MRSIYLIFLFFCTKMVFAHEPELSSFMIYQQNGKTLLLMKCSLTAFEGEIDYHYKKNSYKTPEEFRQLVIKRFQENCTIIINDETIKLINPQVILGHETTLFAELVNTQKKIVSLYTKNSFFKEVNRNRCELILTMKDLPQKQFILQNDNNQEVKLKVENNNWVIDDSVPFYKNFILILLLAFIILIPLILFVTFKFKKSN
jgi:hypothetical protein